MGAQEYIKLRDACKKLAELLERDQSMWKKTHNASATKYFKSRELSSTNAKLEQIMKLLELKIHNYRMLERI